MEQDHKFGQIINLLLGIILLVSVALTVYAINKVRSLNSDAKGKPSVTVTDTGGCMKTTAIQNQRIGVGEIKTHSITFCAGTNMVSWINWGNKIDPAKNLAFSVTNPAGLKITEDDPYDQSTQPLIFFGASNEGVWKFEVVNNGTKNATYELSAGVATN